jgi:coupling of ubiquitin conjugation to ER degradation protein 1
MADTTTTVSETPILPQAAALLVISYLVYRYFFTSTPTAASTSTAPASRRVDPRRLAQQVEIVHGMFPQYTTAAIEAELIRNGGSIEVTTERILNTGFLPDVSSPFSMIIDRSHANLYEAATASRSLTRSRRASPRPDPRFSPATSWSQLELAPGGTPVYRPDHAL